VRFFALLAFALTGCAAWFAMDHNPYMPGDSEWIGDVRHTDGGR